MTKTLYTAEATVTGGRDEGHGRTTDGALDVDLRTPAELGGPGGGTNPEQLFAVGYASCFESAMEVVGRRMKVDVSGSSISSKVHLLPDGGGGFKLAVSLDVSMPDADQEQATALVSKAHEVCPYSNATRGNVDVQVRVVPPPDVD